MREHLEMNQRDFSKRINISQPTLALLETGRRQLRDIYISQICSEFNVNEHWLRTGEGEMFIQPDTFSLDDYAKKNNLTELETAIVKGFISLDPNIREALFQHAKEFFSSQSESTSTVEEKAAEKEIDDTDFEIEEEVERYRRQLISDKKTGKLLSSQKQEKTIGLEEKQQMDEQQKLTGNKTQKG